MKTYSWCVTLKLFVSLLRRLRRRRAAGCRRGKMVDVLHSDIIARVPKVAGCVARGTVQGVVSSDKRCALGGHHLRWATGLARCRMARS